MNPINNTRQSLFRVVNGIITKVIKKVDGGYWHVKLLFRYKKEDREIVVQSRRLPSVSPLLTYELILMVHSNVREDGDDRFFQQLYLPENSTSCFIVWTGRMKIRPCTLLAVLNLLEVYGPDVCRQYPTFLLTLFKNIFIRLKGRKAVNNSINKGDYHTIEFPKSMIANIIDPVIKQYLEEEGLQGYYIPIEEKRARYLAVNEMSIDAFKQMSYSHVEKMNVFKEFASSCVTHPLESLFSSPIALDLHMYIAAYRFPIIFPFNDVRYEERKNNIDKEFKVIESVDEKLIEDSIQYYRALQSRYSKDDNYRYSTLAELGRCQIDGVSGFEEEVEFLLEHQLLVPSKYTHSFYDLTHNLVNSLLYQTNETRESVDYIKERVFNCKRLVISHACDDVGFSTLIRSAVFNEERPLIIFSSKQEFDLMTQNKVHSTDLNSLIPILPSGSRFACITHEFDQLIRYKHFAINILIFYNFASMKINDLYHSFVRLDRHTPINQLTLYLVGPHLHDDRSDATTLWRSIVEEKEFHK
jgi:hypothetical protein